MTRVNRFDRTQAQTLKAPERTPEGYLKVEGRIARIGTQLYRDGAGGMRRELRIPEEVFDEESLASFRQIPITNGHPPEMVNARNATKYAVGATGENVRKDGDFVAAPLLIYDEKAIADAEAGRVQLSNGYSCEQDETQDPALVAKYGKYDSIQRKIRGNHCAMVDAARAGPEARMRLDAQDAESCDFAEPTAPVVVSNPLKNVPQEEPKPMAHELKIDGYKFEVNDPNAQTTVDRAIANAKKDGEDKAAAEKTRADNATKLHVDVKAELSTLQAKHDTLAEKVKKDGAETLKIDGAEISLVEFFDGEKRSKFLQTVTASKVKTRATLLAEARRHLGANEKLDELEDIAIKKLVIAKLKPEAKLDGKDATYIEARYDGAVEDAAKTTPIDRAREQITTPPAGVTVNVDHLPSNDPDAARKAMEARMLAANSKNGARR